MHIRPEYRDFFKTSNAKRWLTRSRGPMPGNIFPTDASGAPLERGGRFITSMDPAYLRFTEALFAGCEKEFPPDVLESGHTGPSGVPGDFSAILSVTRYGMNPLPIPLMDNQSFIERTFADAGQDAPTKIRPQDVKWFNAIMDAFFAYAAPTDLHIRKEGSTSFPYFVKDIQEKKLAALKILREPEHFLRAATSEQRSGLIIMLEEYRTVFLSAIHERQQPDTWRDGKPKPRTAPTEEEARGGKYLGKVMADKRVFDKSGALVDGHSAMRRRDVFGASGPVNYFMSAIVSCFKTVFMKRYAFTYMTTTASDKERKLSRFKYVVGSDVKTMDKTIPRFFADAFFDRLSLYLDERVVEVFRRAYRAPYVAPSPWIKTPPTYDPCYGADPRDPKAFTQNVGLPSGVAYNPIFGRLWMTFVYVIGARDSGVLISPGDIPAFLEGRLDTVLLDSADDATWATNDPVVARKLRDLKSYYAVLTPENPVVYLGDVFALVNGKLRAFPNPNTYLSNLLAREDSVTEPIRWAQGVILRQQLYSAMPAYRDLNALMESCAREHLGFNPNALAAQLAVREPVTDIEALVLLNPAVIHYKVDPATVSKEVLDKVVSTVPHGDWFSYVKHLFRVPIQ